MIAVRARERRPAKECSRGIPSRRGDVRRSRACVRPGASAKAEKHRDTPALMMTINVLATADALSDRDLLARLDHLAGRERATIAELVAHLAALDERRSLYAAKGYSSLFAYCREGGREASPGDRRPGGRARSPAGCTDAHPAASNTASDRTNGRRSTRGGSDRAGRDNFAVAITPAGHTGDCARTVQGAVHRRPGDARQAATASNLLRREIPNGDPATIVDRALTLLLEKVEKAKHGSAAKPRPAKTRVARSETGSPGTRASRHVPREVARAIYKRDGQQCAFVSKDGHRCSERVCMRPSECSGHAHLPIAGTKSSLATTVEWPTEAPVADPACAR
jgi:hypothetical protein